MAAVRSLRTLHGAPGPARGAVLPRAATAGAVGVVADPAGAGGLRGRRDTARNPVHGVA